ncbi:hypothetical protein Slin15195_G035880 [Septoria linicola]|uniref:Uncharacterized protein n=1 Tax=Septoria linicola TaxID=215465 RepID=A0A9Q9AJ17_9PEZI|nr:hypothetical protein Slin14017_G117240 [Septoria linicola]USW50269.1 hypothetical protein Slin15195_G035880 [Septoria linicola]
MLICQPPLLNIDYLVPDCANYPNITLSGMVPGALVSPQGPVTMISNNGFTIGDLYRDANWRLSSIRADMSRGGKNQTDGPFIRGGELQAQARQRQLVRYFPRIILSPNDPIMLDRERIVADLQAAKTERRARRAARGNGNFDSDSDYVPLTIRMAIVGGRIAFEEQ